MAGRKGTGAGGNNQHPDDGTGVRVRTMKSTVIAEFVDAIPDLPDNRGPGWKPFGPQPGVKEALDKAYNAPGHPLILVEYDQGSKSQRRKLAERRVEFLRDQGYSEMAGWVVRAVEGIVYVLYQGER